MKTLRASLHRSLPLVAAALAFAPSVAHAVSLAALFGRGTVTADDKLFSNFVQVDLQTVNGGFADPTKIDITPLIDDPLNPGIKYTLTTDALGTPSGHTGASSVIFVFAYDVQTTNQLPLIKDNSLRIQDWSFDANVGTFIQINEDVFDMAGGTKIGDKQVSAAFPQQPPDAANPIHFDDLNFAPTRQLLHIVTRIEVQGPTDNAFARLKMFEQRFSQIPEPCGALLAAGGVFALIASRRR